MAKNELVEIQAKAKHTLSATELFELAEGSYANGSPWSKISLAEDLKAPYTNYGVALIENKPVAFLGYTHLLDEAEITNFGVLHQKKGQGIGQALLAACMDSLLESGVQKIFLEVRESNLIAVKLYEKEGFREIARRKKYYHQPVEDALIMQWEKQ